MSIGRLFQKRPIRTKLDIYDLSNLKQTNNEIIYYYMSLYIQQALRSSNFGVLVLETRPIETLHL